MAAILVLSPNVRLDCNVRAVRLNRSAEQRVTFSFFFFCFFFSLYWLFKIAEISEVG